MRRWLADQQPQTVWPESHGSPFRGLEVFDEQHAPVFFGRKRAASEVCARLLGNAHHEPRQNFLLLVGASGAGKSSLVRAGVIPRLVHQQPVADVAGRRRWIVRPSELQGEVLEAWAQRVAGVLPEVLEGDHPYLPRLGATVDKQS